MERLTICIPTANRPEFACMAIDSAASQDGWPKMVVVGAGPQPGLVLGSAPVPLKYIETPRDYGGVMTWRIAAEHVDTEYMSLLHDDDWYEPSWARRCLERMAPDVSYVVTEAMICFPDGSTARNLGLSDGSYSVTAWERLLMSMPYTVSPCSVLFRTADVREHLPLSRLPVRGSHSNCMAGHDLLLMLGPLKDPRYKRVEFISEPLANYRAHEGSYTIKAMADPEREAELRENYAAARRYWAALRDL